MESIQLNLLKIMNNFKKSALSILVTFLVGCGGGGGSSDPVTPTIPTDPVTPTIPTDPVTPTIPDEKILKIEDVFDISGLKNVGVKFNIIPKAESYGAKLILVNVPQESELKNKSYSIYSQTEIVFDKAGEYVFEYITSNDKGKIKLTIEDSHLIKGTILKENTVYDDTSKPYVLLGTVGVPRGISLTILPKVTVIGNLNYIQVEGTLDAKGQDNAMVNFHETRINPVNDGGLIKLHYVNYDQGSIYEATGNGGSATLDLQNSILNNLNQYMYIWYPIGDTKIIKNHFKNSQGISFGFSQGQANSIQILNNKFENWTSDFAIKNWANYGDKNFAKIEYNTFMTNNGRYAAVLPSGYTSAELTMPNNYWGTTDLNKIGEMIFDKNDDLSSNDYVNFQPILTQPHPATPK